MDTQPRPNLLSVTSLVCGWLLMGLTLSNLLVIVFLAPGVSLAILPLEGLLGLVSIGTGILGYRASQSLEGRGKDAAVTGMGLSVVALALHTLLFLGGALLFSMLAFPLHELGPWEDWGDY